MGRLRFILFLLGAAWAVSGSGAASADESATLLTGFPSNFARSFTGYRLGLQLAGVGVAAALSLSGGDARVHRAFSSGDADGWANPAVYIVIGLPGAVGGGLYLAGQLRDDDDLLRASFAGLQATALALGYVTVLKFVTGRPAPQNGPEDEILRRSQTFHMGREGIIDGWPSGHTIVTAALGSAVAAYFDRPGVWIAAAGTTAYVAFGMTAAYRGTEHWFSDTVAAALMGYALGSSVGEGYRRKPEAAAPPARATWWPIWDRRGAGIQLQIALGG